jgi:hypothetical protein
MLVVDSLLLILMEILVDENIMHVPEHRKKDIILFDPTDENFPFCLNPLGCFS